MAWLAAAGWQEAAEVFFVLMSMLGQHFNSRREIRGFYFWVAANLSALVLFASLGRWLTCALQGYFLYKSVQGIRAWSELERREQLNCHNEVRNA